MRLLIIAIIIMAQQPAPDSPRAADSHSASQREKPSSRTTEQKPATEKTPSVPTPRSEPTNNQPPLRCADTAANQTNEDIEIQRKIKDFTALLVVVGLLQGIALIGQAVILCYTLKMIGKQTRLMAHHAKSLARVHRAARDNAIAAVALSEEAGKQVSELSKLATATKTSADIAARVSIPTLKIEKFGFGYTGTASMAALLQFPNVEVVIKNYGQTPAFLRSWTIIFTCEDLPKVPVYNDYPGSGIPLEKEVVKAGDSYTLPKVETFKRQKFSDDDIKAVLKQEKTFIAYGYICYTDLFGSPINRHKFCELILNITDTWAQWTELLSDLAYLGTDDLPIKHPPSGRIIVEQIPSADAKAEDRPEKAK